MLGRGPALLAVCAVGILGTSGFALSEIGGSERDERLDLRPVETSFLPNRPNGATVARPGKATFSVHPATLDFRANVVLDLDSPSDGPPAPVHADAKTVPIGSYVEISVRPIGKSSQRTGGLLDPPLELVIDVPQAYASVPDREIIVCDYVTLPGRKAWQPIPLLVGATARPRKASDGYFIERYKGVRRVHVFTRHLTLFGVFQKSATL